MKVLFLMNIGFDSHTTSEHLLSAIIEQLAKAGNDVHVVQMIPDGSMPFLSQNLIDLGVTTEGIVNKSPNKSNFVARYLSAIRYYWKCRHVFKRYRNSDAVFLQSTNTAGFAVWLVRKYLKKAKITFNVQDIFPYNLMYSGKLKKNNPVFKIMAAEQRYGYKHSDNIITISEDMKDTLVADGTPADKIKVIYNWSYQDKPYEDLDLSPISHIFKKEYFSVVYAGNIGMMQNVDIIIETAKLMKKDSSVWFHIIGNGVYKEKLEKRSKEYGIKNISFWSMQPPEIAPLIYSAADANIIPLVKDVYRTALPSKTATCLACQKPIIFAIGKKSKFGQMAEKNAGCILVDSNDDAGIANAIHNIKNTQYKNGNDKMVDFYMEKCSVTSNSREYAEVIVNKE